MNKKINLDKYYVILNCTKDSTDEEIKSTYDTLKKKYSEERFEVGEVGNNAAKKLTELEIAYREVMDFRATHSNKNEYGVDYSQVKANIASGNFSKAQELLDDIVTRDAEWHYLQSVLYYKKNWLNESKKQLEIAVNMAPEVSKYKLELEKLNATINKYNSEFSSEWNRSGNQQGSPNPNGGYQGQYREPRQMGGNGCFDFCCQLIACNALLNCCCNC